MHKAGLTLASLSDSQTICWLNLSQQPEIMQLQRRYQIALSYMLSCWYSLSLMWCRLYRQLSHDKMPDNATDTVESQVEELQKVAAKRLILVVLDGGS